MILNRDVIMKKVVLSAVLVTMLASLAGCASGPSYRIEKGWVKQGANQELANLQLMMCKQKSIAVAERETQVGALVESCMALEGYKWGSYRVRY